MIPRYRKAVYNDLTSHHAELINNVNFKKFSCDYFYHPVGDEKRLRQYGYLALRKIYPCYEIVWPKKQSPLKIPTKYLLWLSDNCTQLYFVGIKKIILFDQDEAILFKMCDADLEIITDIPVS